MFVRAHWNEILSFCDAETAGDVRFTCKTFHEWVPFTDTIQKLRIYWEQKIRDVMLYPKLEEIEISGLVLFIANTDHLKHPNVRKIHAACVDADFRNVTAARFPRLEHLSITNTPTTHIFSTLVGLHTLSIAFTEVRILPATLVNLEYLNIAGTPISRIPPQYTKLRKLYCSHSSVFRIPRQLLDLEYLDCSYTTVNCIPKTLRLEFLNCDHTFVRRFHWAVGHKLLGLSMSFTRIERLPRSFSLIQELHVRQCSLRSIPSNFINLKVVYKDPNSKLDQ